MMWSKLCAALSLPPCLSEAAERKGTELLKPSSLSQPSPRLSVSAESPLLPGVIFIALQLFQELRHADSSPSSARHPIRVPREVFLRKLIEHVLLKEKKNGKQKQKQKNTFALWANSVKHRKPRGKMLGTGSAGNVVQGARRRC